MLQAHPTLQRWAHFLAGGLLNTGLTYGLYFMLQKLFFYQIAYALAYLAGIGFSYWFNARVVFKAPLSWKGLFTYPVVYVVQYCMSALLLGVLIERFGIAPQIGPLLVLVLTIPLTFCLSRWVLRTRPAKT